MTGTAPTLGVVLLWLLFGGSHVGLAVRPLRAALVGRLGERGFLVLYWVVAATTLTALVAFYAAHRAEGAAGLALGRTAALRTLLMGVVGLGVILATFGLADYPRFPTALFAPPVREPRGIERVTRHPFFVGTALVGGAHVLLATRLVGAAFSAGFALLGVVGAWHQDRKLLAARGAPYRAYVDATSVVPFAAMLAGRQPLRARELSPIVAAGGLAAAVALRSVHDSLFADGGAWVVIALLAGALVATGQTWRRAQRRRARDASRLPA
jgi:uncharacterized membrane protein